MRGETATSGLRNAPGVGGRAGEAGAAWTADLCDQRLRQGEPERHSDTDALTEAVRLGKLRRDAGDLRCGRILPISSAMGVKFKEIAGLLAGDESTGTTAEEGVTQLSSVMNAFLQPSDEAEKALARLGCRRGLARRGGTCRPVPVLRTLRTAFGDNNQALAEIFPGIRALRGVFDRSALAWKSTSAFSGGASQAMAFLMSFVGLSGALKLPVGRRRCSQFRSHLPGSRPSSRRSPST